MSFYIFLPVFAIALTRLRAPTVEGRWRIQWIGLGILFGIGIAWNAGVLATIGINDRLAGPLLSSLPAYLDQFALGMALALVMVAPPHLGGRVNAALDRVRPLAWVGIAAALYIVASKGIGLEGGQEPITSLQWFVKHVLFTLIAAALLICAARPLAGADPVGRFLSHPTLRWFGLVSYGIFLWHLAVLSEVESFGFTTPFGAAANWVVWVGVALIPTALIAAFSWYAIERPALARRDWLAGLLSSRVWGRRGAGERT
jgi:peptidoglycan/LPS O-acetylase OafA/YrhL